MELDPEFAMAPAFILGQSYGVLQQYAHGREQIRKAFALRDRASERERFNIVANYYQDVNLDLDRAIENSELWEQSYPRDFNAHRTLGFSYGLLGKHERSAEEYRKAQELDPDQSIPYAGIMANDMNMDRLDEARAVFEEAKSHSVQAGELVERERYRLAFLEGDRETMEKLVAVMSSEHGFEMSALSEQALTAAYFGRLKAARKLAEQMKEKALHEKDTATAANVESDAAFREALFGNAAEARIHVTEAVKLGGEPPTALVLASDAAQAGKMVDSLESQSPADGYVYKVRVPQLRGAIELKRGNPTRALELLAPATTYDAGWFDLYLFALRARRSFQARHTAAKKEQRNSRKSWIIAGLSSQRTLRGGGAPRTWACLRAAGRHPAPAAPIRTSLRSGRTPIPTFLSWRQAKIDAKLQSPVNERRLRSV